MLADGSEFTYDEEVAATYRVISQDTKQVSEWLNSWFRVVWKLQQDVILDFDWFQNVNPQIDWVNYGVTFKNSFVAFSILIYCNLKVKLCSFKVLMHLLCDNKGAESQLTFFSKFQVPKIWIVVYYATKLGWVCNSHQDSTAMRVFC